MAFMYNSLAGNPSGTITRPDNTTGYTAGDVIGTAASATIALADALNSSCPGAKFMVLSAKLEIRVASVPAGMAGFRCHLFNAAPADIADNAPFNIAADDRSKYIGNFDFSTPIDRGATLTIGAENIGLCGALASGSTTLYAILETLGAFTPTALAVKALSLVCVPL